MNVALARFCMLLWLLGFAGMWMTKGVRGMGELPFEVFARMWVVGGLSLCFVVVLNALVGAREAE